MVSLDGAPWFVAGDVCRAIGLCLDARTGSPLFQPSRFSTLHDDEVRLHPMQVNLRDGRVQLRRMWVVAEAGLYKMILRSDKSTARSFQDWVVREVLPAIRKTGGYVLAGADPAAVEVGATEMMPLPATFTEALRQHAATLIKLAEEQGASRRRDWEARARTEAEKQAAEATINRDHNSLNRDHGDRGGEAGGRNRVSNSLDRNAQPSREGSAPTLKSN